MLRKGKSGIEWSPHGGGMPDFERQGWIVHHGHSGDSSDNGVDEPDWMAMYQGVNPLWQCQGMMPGQGSLQMAMGSPTLMGFGMGIPRGLASGPGGMSMGMGGALPLGMQSSMAPRFGAPGMLSPGVPMAGMRSRGPRSRTGMRPGMGLGMQPGMGRGMSSPMGAGMPPSMMPGSPQMGPPPGMMPGSSPMKPMIPGAPAMPATMPAMPRMGPFGGIPGGGPQINVAEPDDEDDG